MRRATGKRVAAVRRARRVSARVRGAADRPRLSVFRSHRYVSAQLIDDAAGVTLAAASDRELAHGARSGRGASRIERAGRVGERIAALAKERGIRAVRFDRGRYRYHGLVRALADGARRGGLAF